MIHNYYILQCTTSRTTTTTAPATTQPPETPTDTTPLPEEYEDFFVGSSSPSSFSEPSPTERKEIDAGSVVYEDEYGNPIYVDENGEVYYPSAEGSGENGGSYEDYGYYGEYGHPGITPGPPDEGEEAYYGTESGPRGDQQGIDLYDTESEFPLEILPETTAESEGDPRVVFATSESSEVREGDILGGEEFTIVREEVTTDVLAGILNIPDEEEIFGSNTTSSPQLLPPECLAVLKNLTSDNAETFDLTEAMALVR